MHPLRRVPFQIKSWVPVPFKTNAVTNLGLMIQSTRIFIEIQYIIQLWDFVSLYAAHFVALKTENSTKEMVFLQNKKFDGACQFFFCMTRSYFLLFITEKGYLVLLIILTQSFGWKFRTNLISYATLPQSQDLEIFL